MRDTHPDASAAQLRWYRALGPAGRVALAAAMSEDARQIAMAGIRQRHPDYSAEQVRLALMRLLHGETLARRAWPASADVRP